MHYFGVIFFIIITLNSCLYGQQSVAFDSPLYREFYYTSFKYRVINDAVNNVKITLHDGYSSITIYIIVISSAMSNFNN